MTDRRIRRVPVRAASLAALLLLLIAATLSSCAASTPPQLERILEATREHRIDIEGDRRSYLLQVPASYDAATSHALVLVLHGRGSSARAAQRRYGFAELAEKEGFVAVYPSGEGFIASWKSVFGDGFDSDADVKFLGRLIEQLTREYRIDPGRVFVAGHSAGGMMAHRLAAERSDIIAGIGVVAGAIGTEEDDGRLRVIPNPTQPVSAIMLHSMADTVVPYGPEASVEARYGFFLPVEAAKEFWIHFTGASRTGVTESFDGGELVLERHDGGRRGTGVALLTMMTAGHNWPVKKPDPGNPGVMRGVDAARLIWEFFKAHPRQPEG